MHAFSNVLKNWRTCINFRSNKFTINNKKNQSNEDYHGENYYMSVDIISFYKMSADVSHKRHFV